jgi:hypothetical protein
MRLVLSGFFLFLMVCLTVVTPRILSETNFAEIVEEESSTSNNSLAEEIKSHYSPFQIYNKNLASKVISEVSNVRFLHYNAYHQDPHILEIDAPPPDAV